MLFLRLDDFAEVGQVILEVVKVHIDLEESVRWDNCFYFRDIAHVAFPLLAGRQLLSLFLKLIPRLFLYLACRLGSSVLCDEFIKELFFCLRLMFDQVDLCGVLGRLSFRLTILLSLFIQGGVVVAAWGRARAICLSRL